MRHKHIILILFSLLLVLLVIKIALQIKENKEKAALQQIENTTYPLRIEFEYLTSSYQGNPNDALKIKFAIENRTNNHCENPLFFLKSDIVLGMTKEAFEAKETSDDTIYLNDKPVPCQVLYNFPNDSTLESVYVQINIAETGDFTDSDIILSYFGEKRIDLTTDSGLIYKHIWYYPDFYVYFDHTHFDTFKNKAYISVCRYSAKSNYTLPQLVRHGGCSEYNFEGTSSSSKRSSSYGYKYGDSDTYQGSSQQAADLAAIDAYFGF